VHMASDSMTCSGRRLYQAGQKTAVFVCVFLRKIKNRLRVFFPVLRLGTEGLLLGNLMNFLNRCRTSFPPYFGKR
jgi:hypothetical protein